ncbi:MAG: alpha/beta hydrolase family protein [Akkermansia sp.]
MKLCLSLSVLGALLIACTQTQAATVREVMVPSKALNKEARLNVILPDSYQSTPANKRYPVIYLLHGHSDDHTAWASRAPIAELADEYQIIFVCPNGEVSWYFNSYTNPQLKIETHIAQEVVPFVDKNFRTIASRKARAITGNSMGGHGALYLGVKHPELFGALGSLSGGVDFTPFPNNWNIKDNLGSYEENKERWQKNTAVSFLPKVKKGQYAIVISCGTEDVFTQVNKNLDEALTKNGIKHEYLSSPGEHSWPYWKEAIKVQTQLFDQFFHLSSLKGKSSQKASMVQ